MTKTMSKREIELIKNLEAAQGCYIIARATCDIAWMTLRAVINADGRSGLDDPCHPASLAKAVQASAGKAQQAASHTVHRCYELIEANSRQSSSSADFKAFKENCFLCMNDDEQVRLLDKILEKYNAND